MAPPYEYPADLVAAGSPVVVRDRRRNVLTWPRGRLTWWELATIVVGVAAAVVAVILTLRSEFLAYPGWLAAQKADLILGPIAVGLYWRRRRPRSRFGPMLIALGLVHVPYILQSSANSTLFTIGGLWGEVVVYLATLVIILAFPSGRLRPRSDGVVLGCAAVFAALPAALLTIFLKEIFAGGSISGCRSACPRVVAEVSVSHSVVRTLTDVGRAGIIGVAAAGAVLVLWRLATGTPPQRRALAIGTPVALLFLMTQAAYQLTVALGDAGSGANTYLRWIFVGARSALWYGFLVALIAAQLFAARVLRRIIADSLRRPSLHELETLLRKPLGDPRLRLAFRRPGADEWIDGDGEVITLPTPGSGRALTELEHEGRPAVAIEHDVQLADDPELLEAAAATALLAFEYAELQASWNASLDELRESRARLAAATDRERQSIERDLHDGPQQALFALSVKLGMAAERVPEGDLRRLLSAFGDELDGALDELRDLAHGIYPSVLVDLGLVLALRSVADSAGRRVEVTGDGVGRYAPEVESAIYYCCREALQNALRHAGRDAHISIRLTESADELRFEVQDDGRGFDPQAPHSGSGLRNMADRISALNGHVQFVGAPGHGTSVSGAVPLVG